MKFGLDQVVKNNLDRLAEYYHATRLSGRSGVVGVYGIPDFEVLDYFKGGLGKLLFNSGNRDMTIRHNEKGDISIDLGAHVDYIFGNIATLPE